MAKTSAAKPPAPADTPSDIDLASKALRMITGCGSIELKRRLAALDDSTIKQIATAERTGKRNNVPNILAAHEAKSRAKATEAKHNV